jgi:hypothetical protein
MIVMVDARKVQVLLTVLQRAPATVAEQLVCEEVAALLVQLVDGQDKPPTNGSPKGAAEVS